MTEQIRRTPFFYLYAEIASVHVVSQKEVACVTRRPSNFKQPHQIKELSVNVATHWGRKIGYSGKREAGGQPHTQPMMPASHTAAALCSSSLHLPSRALLMAWEKQQHSWLELLGPVTRSSWPLPQPGPAPPAEAIWEVNQQTGDLSISPSLCVTLSNPQTHLQ